RVLTYNIHHAEGVDGRIDLERIAAVIRRAEADLVALQEVDRGVERSGCVDQPERPAALTGMQIVFAKNIDHEGGAYGNAVLSRFPVEGHRNHRLPRTPPNEQRGLLEIHIQPGGNEFVFLATHLDHQADDDERVPGVAVIGDLVTQMRRSAGDRSRRFQRQAGQPGDDRNQGVPAGHQRSRPRIAVYFSCTRADSANRLHAPQPASPAEMRRAPRHW
ncbi:MAG: endonuclease/exonuclease/phosphatase family protein, partial [Planctomycetes bacterium]|nr:endonuclease/exonuclease/phosphatase family protein [Planctomycetota bacterium]